MDMSLALGVSLLGFFTIAPPPGVQSPAESAVTSRYPGGGWLLVAVHYSGGLAATAMNQGNPRLGQSTVDDPPTGPGHHQHSDRGDWTLNKLLAASSLGRHSPAGK